MKEKGIVTGLPAMSEKDKVDIRYGIRTLTFPAR